LAKISNLKPIVITGSKTFHWSLALACFLFVLRGAAADAKFSLPSETAKLKAGPGFELAVSQCALCHSADYISTQPRLTSAQWRASIVKMQAKYGAPIATNKVDALVEYFARNYGAGGTNTPPAK
jgi:cytochrome c553